MEMNVHLQKIKKVFDNGVSCPKKSLMEIIDNERILIENHTNVLLYKADEIHIQVSFGKICVYGSGLIFAQLSTEQLVIRGRIDSVVLCKE